MKTIAQEAFQYGKSDWDTDYLNWGFHDVDTQMIEAESVMRMLPQDTPLKILDLACGLGTHAVYWSQLGHEVVGADISEVFVKKARETVCNAAFMVGDIRSLPDIKDFDVVTWIEHTFFDENMLNSIAGYLVDGGCFIMDVRNPDHPRTKQRNGIWRTWREENGIFYIECHEIDDQSGMRHDEWIEIDTNIDTVTRKMNSFQPQSLDMIQDMLKDKGFKNIELKTISGEIFAGGSDDYWLWLIAKK